MYRLRAADRLRYFLERQFIKGAGYQLLVVALLVGLVSLVGGLLILPTGDETISEAVWWAFLRLTDPGYLGDDAGNWRRSVSTWLTISGYVLFMGTLIAILTQWLTRFMRGLEQGLTPMTASGHIVVLGMGSRTLPLVEEILHSRDSLRRFLRTFRRRRAKIAVLSDVVNAEVAGRLRRHDIVGRHARDLILRSGSALDNESLRRVNVSQAAAVILPGDIFHGDANQSEDISAVKTLIALRGEAAVTGSSHLPLVVAELQDARQADVARAAYPGPLALVCADECINRVIVQQLRYPGIARAYTAIFTHDAPSRLYARSVPELVGNAFGELHRHFPDAIVCGIARPHGRDFDTRLNPPAATRLAHNDRIVFIASEFDATAPISKVPAAVRAEVSTGPRLQIDEPSRVRLLILGWNQRHVALLGELAQRSGRYDIDVVSVQDVGNRQRQCERVLADATNIHCRHIEADSVVGSDLRECRPEAFDAVLIARSELVATGQEADARTVVGHLVLQRLLGDKQPRPRVLVELAEAGNQSLLGTHADDVVVTPLLISHLLGQAALCRELLSAFEALLRIGGCDLALIDAAPAMNETGSAKASALSAMLAARGVIFLGWLAAERNAMPVIQPDDNDSCPSEAGTRLLVLTPGPDFDAS